MAVAGAVAGAGAEDRGESCCYGATGMLQDGVGGCRLYTAGWGEAHREVVRGGSRRLCGVVEGRYGS